MNNIMPEQEIIFFEDQNGYGIWEIMAIPKRPIIKGSTKNVDPQL
jgi:hypothetical protein